MVIINMSKFLVLPSYSENFGNVVIEGNDMWLSAYYNQ